MEWIRIGDVDIDGYGEIYDTIFEYSGTNHDARTGNKFTHNPDVRST